MLLFQARTSPLLRMSLALQDLKAWRLNNSSSTSKLFCNSNFLNCSQPPSNRKDLLLPLHNSSRNNPPSRMPAASSSKSFSMAFTASSSNRHSNKPSSSKSSCWVSLTMPYRRQDSPNSSLHNSSSSSNSNSHKRLQDNSSIQLCHKLKDRASDPSPTQPSQVLTSSKLSISSNSN